MTDSLTLSFSAALPCIVCGRPLDNAIAGLLDDTFSGLANLPADATIFTSHGNYGSTVFDPLDGSLLQVNICDACLLTGQASGRVIFAPRAPAPPPPVLAIWDGYAPESAPASDSAAPAPAQTPLAPDLTAKIVAAPWSEDQVASLNAFQTSGFHPFTCGPSSHPLVATPEGWICAFDAYTQDWAHTFMLDWSWRDLVPTRPAGSSWAAKS
jgi:hypothetical protein